MEFVQSIIDIVLHLDVHLNQLAINYGVWMYAILFAIIFAETGLVVTPFLPGDSLLFAVGALCAIDGSPLNLGLMMVLLIIAAVTGDAVNYAIGFKVGPKVFYSETSRLLNKKHLLKTQRFYEKYGGKAIVFARWVPIIRTFAPFVAGIGKMSYRRFAFFNVTGGVAWVVALLAVGYGFGNRPFVKQQFHYVIFGIIFISILPIVIEFVRERLSPTVGTTGEG